MPCFVELIGGRQSRRSGPDDGDFLAGPERRRRRLDPTVLEPAVDDGALDVLDGHRRFVDAQDAGSFARGRADAAYKNRFCSKCILINKGFKPFLQDLTTLKHLEFWKILSLNYWKNS